MTHWGTCSRHLGLELFGPGGDLNIGPSCCLNAGTVQVVNCWSTAVLHSTPSVISHLASDRFG
eukprot:15482879-Alexandrium_andersonii.AAC.1